MNTYVFGSSPEELERLTFQATVLRPITARLLSDVGLTTNMHVLDLGSGAGDVAMLAAEYVGVNGSVLGIDLSEQAVELARYRVLEAGLQQVRFEVCDIKDFSSPCLFDCVIGRYVMVHQSDPVAFLRKAASLVKPGGVLALHEILLVDPLIESHPAIAMWSRAGDWIVAAIRARASHHDIAANMVESFFDAGLPYPELSCERPIGGGKDSLMYRWACEGVKAVYPHLIRMGLATPETEDLDTFESRLRSKALETHAQLLGPTQITAWVRMESRKPAPTENL